MKTLVQGEDRINIIKKIISEVNFGLYEDILMKNDFDDIWVVSIMGC